MLPTNPKPEINTNTSGRPAGSNSSLGESSKVSDVVAPVLKACKICGTERPYTSKDFYAKDTGVEKCMRCYSSLERRNAKEKKEKHLNSLYGPNGIYRKSLSSSCSNTSRSDTPFISIARSSVSTPVLSSPPLTESLGEDSRDISAEGEAEKKEASVISSNHCSSEKNEISLSENPRKRSLSPKFKPMPASLRRKLYPKPPTTFLWQLAAQRIADPGPLFPRNPGSEDLD